MDFRHPDERTAFYLGFFNELARKEAAGETTIPVAPPAAGAVATAPVVPALRVGNWDLTTADKAKWDTDQKAFFGDHFYTPLLSKLSNWEWGRNLIGWLIGQGFGGDALKETVSRNLAQAANLGGAAPKVDPRSFHGIMFQNPNVHKAVFNEMADYFKADADPTKRWRMRNAIYGTAQRGLNQGQPGIESPDGYWSKDGKWNKVLNAAQGAGSAVPGLGVLSLVPMLGRKTRSTVMSAIDQVVPGGSLVFGGGNRFGPSWQRVEQQPGEETGSNDNMLDQMSRIGATKIVNSLVQSKLTGKPRERIWDPRALAAYHTAPGRTMIAEQFSDAVFTNPALREQLRQQYLAGATDPTAQVDAPLRSLSGGTF